MLGSWVDNSLMAHGEVAKQGVGFFLLLVITLDGVEEDRVRKLNGGNLGLGICLFLVKSFFCQLLIIVFVVTDIVGSSASSELFEGHFVFGEGAGFI